MRIWIMFYSGTLYFHPQFKITARILKKETEQGEWIETRYERTLHRSKRSCGAFLVLGMSNASSTTWPSSSAAATDPPFSGGGELPAPDAITGLS